MPQFSTFFVFLLLLTSLACRKNDDAPISTDPEMPEIEQGFPISYVADPAGGQLPYPQHDPVMTAAEVQAQVDDLFIINNYGQYQCGTTPEECYFHNGLDIMLPNGTPIFAVEAGTIQANTGGNEFYRTLVIEDDDEPGWGWAYTHINFFSSKANVEAHVEQGQYLGRVNFLGLEHIHFGRVKLREGGRWDVLGDIIYHYPNDYFYLPDTKAPVFRPPLHFFLNNTDDKFEHGVVDTVSGAVDIVASVRDESEYSGGIIDGGNYWGDRLCVERIDYRILFNGQVVEDRTAFDFTKLTFSYRSDRASQLATVYKFHLLLNPDFDTRGFNRYYSDYILTNARNGLSGLIDTNDSGLAWNTESVDANGLALYPNGLYHIEVTATDDVGNSAMLLDSVYIQN